MEELLLPGSVALFVFAFGFSLFKKFLKFVILLALVAGTIAYFSQDIFAYGITDCLTGNGCSKPEKTVIDFGMVENDDGTVLIFHKRKILPAMKITSENSVTIFDRKARKLNLGTIKSDLTIKKMIRGLYGNPELFNVEEKPRDEDDDDEDDDERED